MNVAIGVDHRGYAIKSDLISILRAAGCEVIDFGAHSEESVDYPDYAAVVAESVASGQADRGIIVCGSGVGACVAANKVAGVRAGMCHDTYSARQGVEHDDMNVLCLGSGIVGLSLIQELLDAFLGARFADHEERYVRRLHKVQALERGTRLKP
ncbi:MAG: ribose 5-phosphate isomerase B [Chloroflexi bacterium]|nr:ribose 5-phosphate isomerase B [Chloroflexota bacterium]MCY3958124.1 ribose 5-phosphate isomerase B [Chloroflexota bacterium]